MFIFHIEQIHSMPYIISNMKKNIYTFTCCLNPWSVQMLINNFSTNSVPLGFLNAFSRCPPWCVRLGVSAFLKVLTPFVPLLRWCVRLPEVLDSLCLQCTPACLLSLDGAFAFPFLFSLVGWCARLPEGLVSPLSPIVPLLYFLGWMVCLPLEGLASVCLPLHPLLFPFLLPFVSHCTLACFPLMDGVSASLGSCLPLSLISNPFFFPCAGWRVRLPKGLVFFVSHCTPSVSNSGATCARLRACVGPKWDLCWAYVGPCSALEGHAGAILSLC